MFHIALVNPLIPQNTGNIGRLCAGTDTMLHLVGQLGFSLEDRYLKRAGLDYWPHVMIRIHATYDDFLQEMQTHRFWLFSVHTDRIYTEIDFQPDDVLVFGSETTGLSADIRERHPGRIYKIPINQKIRSLNLANAASIVLFEALRQGAVG